MKITTNLPQIEELLSRGVDKVYPSCEELKTVLLSGKKLKLYQGFDPTGTKLHVGHMVGLRKLAQWQNLGHEVIFLIGDGTGQAGDPSGKTSTREKFHTQKELRKNAKNYVLQAKKIVKFTGKNKAKILYNGDWLNKLKLIDILSIAQNFSLQQLSERDLYQTRMKNGEEVNLREFLYPLLQGYDSVAMKVDLELGGSDQTFNMLCGRTLTKRMLQKEKFVMTTPLISDKSGRKIGKTEGNVIALDDEPSELYGKIMSLPDEVILQCFECLTTIPMTEVKDIREAINRGENPMVFKKKLSHQIVLELYDAKSAQKAEADFSNTFQKGEVPASIENSNQKLEEELVEVAVRLKVVNSKSEFRRLVEGGAITNLDTGEKITDVHYIPKDGTKLKIGSRRFLKINIAN